MKEIIVDTIIDIVKIIPFLFVAFFIMEYLEHKLSKSEKTIKHLGKYGPLIGSIFGAIPQCGFSVMATNLYATRIITLGTLISIYLSTSDEMLPILISSKVSLILILKIILLKIVIGFICGFIIDFIFRKKQEKQTIKDFCEDEHCDCNHNFLKSVLTHTFNITLFLLIITFIINTIIHYLGTDKLGQFLLKDTFFSPFISSLIGLIPNCASSIILTELYLNNALSFASLLAGLLTGSGVALLVLFRVNKNFKENVFILMLIYFLGVITGIFLEFLTLLS